MAYVENDAITVMSDEEAWDLLTREPIGRLATTIGDDIEMFPINYVLDGRTIVFRTAQGSKLFELTVNSRVAFEVDSYEDEGGWSIVVHGDAEVLEDPAEIETVEQLPLRPWVPTIKTTYVRIRPNYLSGHRFRFGDEPEAWHL